MNINHCPVPENLQRRLCQAPVSTISAAETAAAAVFTARINLAHRSADVRIKARAHNWRGGRAVDCTGLENRQAERPREFESHPLRQLQCATCKLRWPLLVAWVREGENAVRLVGHVTRKG